MFEFIKNLFRSKSAKPSTPAGPILVHADIGETIVITEVALASVKPKTAKPKTTKLKEVKPIATVTEIKPAVAKGVKAAKPKTPKPKQAKVEPAKIVQLVQPLPTKKKGRPKKDTTV
jgi:hypothetical protein